jgi:integrase
MCRPSSGARQDRRTEGISRGPSASPFELGKYLGCQLRNSRASPKAAGLHSLRHYFATRLIHQGASVKCVQLALGHATPTIALNTYVGEWPDTDQETSAIMDAALGQVPRMCPPVKRRG